VAGSRAQRGLGLLGRGPLIFASVGSMLPFERFVRAVDEWAQENPAQDVFLQIGETKYEPRYAPFARMVPMTEYRRHLRQCDLFVAHVGMGSILQALEDRKQTLMLPRHQEWGEHTTDHQIHTAERFSHLPGLKMVDTVEDLRREMSALLTAPLALGDAISNQASPELIAGVRNFLNGVKA
jgi:UDP-N-acetylglucosamine transferase subunit ALG13